MRTNAQQLCKKLGSMENVLILVLAMEGQKDSGLSDWLTSDLVKDPFSPNKLDRIRCLGPIAEYTVDFAFRIEGHQAGSYLKFPPFIVPEEA